MYMKFFLVIKNWVWEKKFTFKLLEHIKFCIKNENFEEINERHYIFLILFPKTFYK